VAGLRAGVEHIDTETRIAEADTAAHRTYYTAAALLWRDTFDRTAFPTRGISVRLRSVVGNDRLGGHTSFVQHLLDVEQLVPLSRRTVLRLRGIAGGGSGGDLPLHRRFFLGGVHPSPAFPETQPIFWGLEPQERSGTAVQLARVSLQRELLGDVFATVGVNVGNAFERWTPSEFEYIAGWGASLGLATPIGPVEATVSGRTLGEWPTFSLSIGPAF
jgi:outer membrane protein assembly factor BamA